MAIDVDDDARSKADGGLSRRSMIKGAAVAGAAAWTAPIIIDSLSSPAAAGSICNKYWVKLRGPANLPLGGCFSACPGGGYVVSDAQWAGDCQDPCCGVSGGAQHMPTVTGTGPYTVTLPTGCSFSTATGFSLAGRYGTGTGDTYNTVTGIPNGATTASINKTFGSSPTKTLAYIYVKFCCTTAGTGGGGQNND
jgi:hypothetical protein